MSALTARVSPLRAQAASSCLPTGYIQTEIGLFPAEWPILPLGELLTFQNGINADKAAYGIGVPFANVLEVITHTHLNELLVPGRVTIRQSQQDNYQVQHGDILFNRTSETQEEIGLASVYLGAEPIVFGGFVIRGRPVSRRLDAVFSAWGLRAPAVRSQIIARGQGAIRANIGQSDLRTVLVPLPPLREQHAIAEALSDADALIESLEQLIAKKRAIKQGAMQELLTGKRRLPGFKGVWAKVHLRTLGTFLKGSGVRKDEALSGSIPCVRYGEIYTTHNDRIRAFSSWISPEVAATALKLRCGDILFAGSGETKEEIGKCVAFLDDIEAYAGGDIVVLRPSDACAKFLGYFLNSCPIAAQKASKGQGDAVVHISSLALGGIELFLPSHAEQSAIAGVLSDIDDEIGTLEVKLAKACQVKQGMMQELLTGRIRLV